MVNLRTTPDERKRLAELEQAATPGEVRVEHWPEMEIIHAMISLVSESPGRPGGRGVAGFLGLGQAEADRDANLYAAARNALPALLADLATLEAEVARLAGEVNDEKQKKEWAITQLKHAGHSLVDLSKEILKLTAERDDLARRLAECQYERGK